MRAAHMHVRVNTHLSAVLLAQLPEIGYKLLLWNVREKVFRCTVTRTEPFPSSTKSFRLLHVYNAVSLVDRCKKTSIIDVFLQRSTSDTALLRLALFKNQLLVFERRLSKLFPEFRSVDMRAWSCQKLPRISGIQRTQLALLRSRLPIWRRMLLSSCAADAQRSCQQPIAASYT